MAFIFQAYNLIDYLTPAENVSLTSKLPPLPILERLGLTKEEAKRNVLKLSGASSSGWPSPVPWPTTQRDHRRRAHRQLRPCRSLEIMSLLEKINDMGTTILVVTHERELVNRFGKRVVAIESGRIISDAAGGYYGNG